MRDYRRLLHVYNCLKVVLAEAEPTACAEALVAKLSVGKRSCTIVGVVLVCGLQQCNGASRSLVEVYLLTTNAASFAVAEGSCADVCRFLQGDGSGV